MGMFRRIGKDIKRSIESQERNEEFTLALDMVKLSYLKLQSYKSEDFLLPEVVNELTKYLGTVAKYRDATTKLNLHALCAKFSAIHFNIMRLYCDSLTLNGKAWPVNYDEFGCKQIHALNSDIRYLAWGWRVGVVSSEDFWVGKDFLEDYKSHVKESLKQKFPGGSIPIPTLGGNKSSQSYNEYFELLNDPIHYAKPDRN
jgi:hypothetical protein